MTKQRPDLVGRGERPTFDFIVVGAGPAGCAVAARLAQSSSALSVALIEAGPAKASLLSDVPSRRRRAGAASLAARLRL
jgi:choline dehydrogenase-like flavoprotein